MDLLKLIDASNSNLNNKYGSEEYASTLSEMVGVINQLYPNIPKYNYPENGECPDLREYNVHYNNFDNVLQFEEVHSMSKVA